MEIDAAEKYLRSHSGVRAYKEMGYAKLDTDRKRRSGFAEVIYCQGKSDEFLPEIFRKLYEAEGEVFGTRADAHQYEIVRAVLPDISYDPVSRILKLEKKDKEHIGLVVVCTGGTADIPVAEEAAQTAEYFGSRVERIMMWESAVSTAFYPAKRKYGKPTASLPWQAFSIWLSMR